MMNETKSDKITKICFVALGAYPLLTGKNPKNVIGPDVHQVVLATELIKHNYKVTVITYDEGGETVESINDIEIIKTYRVDSHLNIMSKVFRIWNAMRKVNTHIFIYRGGVPGVVSLFCRLTGKRFICSIASDALVNRRLINKEIKEFSRSKFSLDTVGTWLDIKLSNIIIVQNEYQREMLTKNFAKDGILIKTPFPQTDRGMPEKVKPPIVLWVGAMADVKQPELFVKLAEWIPDARFQMIGGHSGIQEDYNKLKAISNRISNLEFLGVIPFHKINEYFSRASILVNTSMFEGFPHAFIQAWMHYMPVISLSADPDEIIYKYKMGFHSKTFEQMVEDVKILLKNKALMEEMGVNGRKYVEREHDITNIIREYIELFDHIDEL